MKKNVLLISILFFTLILSGCSIKSSKLSLNNAKTKAESFINENFMQNGEKVTISDIKLEGGLYKLTINLPSGQKIDSYMTVDGTKLFESAIDMVKKNASTTDSGANQNQAPVANAPKSDKPVVEVFVMSHCPYGTQIEKGIIPVAETLKDKINFSIKFCDYAMHGEKEVKEELKQYCISKEQPTKYFAYLKCFLKAGDGDTCMKTANIASVDSCFSKSDKEFSITKSFNDKTTWKGDYPSFSIFAKENAQYGVQGSPTLIINGTSVDSARDSKSLLGTICNAFNNAPEECKTELSGAAPTPGFGEGTTTGDTSGSGCATPAQ